MFLIAFCNRSDTVRMMMGWSKSVLGWGKSVSGAVVHVWAAVQTRAGVGQRVRERCWGGESRWPDVSRWCRWVSAGGVPGAAEWPPCWRGMAPLGERAAAGLLAPNARVMVPAWFPWVALRGCALAVRGVPRAGLCPCGLRPRARLGDRAATGLLPRNLGAMALAWFSGHGQGGRKKAPFPGLGAGAGERAGQERPSGNASFHAMASSATKSFITPGGTPRGFSSALVGSDQPS